MFVTVCQLFFFTQVKVAVTWKYNISSSGQMVVFLFPMLMYYNI